MPARVPRVGAGDIRVNRTTLPQVNIQGRNFTAGSTALTNLGQGVSDLGSATAEVGIINARKDESREAQARMVRFKQDVFDWTYGNADKGITGYRQTNGQESLDGGKALRDKIEELRSANSAEISNPNVQGAFTAASTIEREATYETHAQYLEQQRGVAGDAVDLADLEIATRDAVASPGQTEQKMAEIMRLGNKMLDRRGEKDPDVRAEFIRNFTTAAASATIDRLLSDPERGPELAASYFKTAQSLGLMTAKDQTNAINKIRNNGILKGGQDVFDEVNLDGVSAADQIEKIRAMDRPAEVRKEAVRLVDLEEGRRIRAENQAQAAAVSGTYLAIIEGKSLADVARENPEQFNLMVASGNLNSMQLAEKKRALGEIYSTTSDGTTLTELKALPDAGLIAKDLTVEQPNLTESEYKEVVNLQEAKKDRIEDLTTNRAIYNAAHKALTFAAPTKYKGWERSSKQSTKFKVMQNATDEMDAFVYSTIQRTGNPPSVPEYTKEAQRLMIRASADVPGEFFSGIPLLGPAGFVIAEIDTMTPKERDALRVDIDDVPPETVTKLQGQFQRLGKVLKDETIERIVAQQAILEDALRRGDTDQADAADARIDELVEKSLGLTGRQRKALENRGS